MACRSQTETFVALKCFIVTALVGHSFTTARARLPSARLDRDPLPRPRLTHLHPGSAEGLEANSWSSAYSPRRHLADIERRSRSGSAHPLGEHGLRIRESFWSMLPTRTRAHPRPLRATPRSFRRDRSSSNGIRGLVLAGCTMAGRSAPYTAWRGPDRRDAHRERRARVAAVVSATIAELSVLTCH